MYATNIKNIVKKNFNLDRKNSGNEFVFSLILSLPLAYCKIIETRKQQCPPTLSLLIPSILLVCPGDASTWVITVESSFSFSLLMHKSNRSYMCTQNKIYQTIPLWKSWAGEISLIRIQKSPFSQLRNSKVRLTLLQLATENSKKRQKKQRTKDQE
jgi:hypothetical protein